MCLGAPKGVNPPLHLLLSTCLVPTSVSDICKAFLLPVGVFQRGIYISLRLVNDTFFIGWQLRVDLSQISAAAYK